jgi:threonine dehydratase
LFELNEFSRTRGELSGHVRVTPLVCSESLTAQAGSQVYLKLESLQLTHSFKIRGAYGALLPRLEEARRCGVVTGSSGNFAQGLAYAARELGVKVTVVMLERSAAYKVGAARRLGADIVFCPNDFSQRAEMVERINREQGKLILHSYDDEHTIRGNGALGFELLEQLPNLDAVLLPCSGGGLLAGVAAVVKQLRPRVKVYGVQPENLPAMKVSLEKGTRTRVEVTPSVADGIVADLPGELNFPLIQKYVDDVFLVSEDEIVRAVAHLFLREKLVVEPAGALTVAALQRFWPGRAARQKIAAVISGGNVEFERLIGLVRQACD